MQLLRLSYFSLIPFSVSAFSWRSAARSFRAASLIATRCDASTEPAPIANNWLGCGLLFSSFSDGLMNNEGAKTFLRHGIERALWIDARSRYERKIETSAVASPCNGPDIEALNRLESIDEKLKSLSKASSVAISSTEILHYDVDSLRVVYIPTALYALRRESNSSPGKQRQRARADGKKRRNEFLEFLQHEIANVPVSAVTLDLDDGSVKHPQGQDRLPNDCYRLLEEWKPHVVFVEGGNTFWLHHCMEKGSWRRPLQQLLSRPGTVYCGKSAGAILAGNSVETAHWKGWDDPLVVPGSTGKETKLAGLDLLGGSCSIFPHMNESWDDLVTERRCHTDHDVELLTDQDVLCVDGTTQSRELFTTDLTKQNVILLTSRAIWKPMDDWLGQWAKPGAYSKQGWNLWCDQRIIIHVDHSTLGPPDGKLAWRFDTTKQRTQSAAAIRHYQRERRSLNSSLRPQAATRQ